MKTWGALFALMLLAGCLGDEPTTEGATAPGVPTAAPVATGPVTVEGTLWLPPSSGQTREETLIELPANASGLRIVGHLVLGAAYGPAELPVTMADVEFELRDAAGTVLASGHLTVQSREGEIEATTEGVGPHVLALLSYGGSDGSGNGDHVHYTLEIAPAAA